jgi:uncharacterized membrane protein
MFAPQEQEPLDQEALAMAMPKGLSQMMGMSALQEESLGNPQEEMPLSEEEGQKSPLSVTFGFGDKLPKQDLEALQQALANSLQTQHDTAEEFQSKRIKQAGAQKKEKGAQPGRGPNLAQPPSTTLMR